MPAHRYRSLDSIVFHRQCAMRHALRRAHDRLNVDFSESDVRSHGRLIAGGFSTKLGTGGGKRELHSVIIDGRTYFPVWCPNINQIVTYLRAPREWRGGFTVEGAALVMDQQMSTSPATENTNVS